MDKPHGGYHWKSHYFPICSVPLNSIFSVFWFVSKLTAIINSLQPLWTNNKDDSILTSLQFSQFYGLRSRPRSPSNLSRCCFINKSQLLEKNKKFLLLATCPKSTNVSVCVCSSSPTTDNETDHYNKYFEYGKVWSVWSIPTIFVVESSLISRKINHHRC